MKLAAEFENEEIGVNSKFNNFEKDNLNLKNSKSLLAREINDLVGILAKNNQSSDKSSKNSDKSDKEDKKSISSTVREKQAVNWIEMLGLKKVKPRKCSLLVPGNIRGG